MRSPARITLRGSERRGDTMMLIFGVDGPGGEISATVGLNPCGPPWFPHDMCESGLSIDPSTDAALRDQAARLVAVFEANETWHAIRPRHRRPGR